MLDWIKAILSKNRTRKPGALPDWAGGAYRPLASSVTGRAPSSRELLAELRTTAYACATINAGVCASFVPRLYLRLGPNDPLPNTGLGKRVDAKSLAVPMRSGSVVHEVTEHPLLDLLRSVNDQMNGHDLLELTALSMEVLGNAYWWLEGDPPGSIWPLPAQRMRQAGGNDAGSWILDGAAGPILLEGDRVIHFRIPVLEDLYGPGMGPMRAAFEPAALASRFHAYRRGLWENAAVPGVVLSTSQPLGEEEVARIESRWQQRFGKGGSGRLLVTDADFKVSTIQYSPADMASLAEAGATREEIANAFGVPLAYLTSDTNLANLQAAREQHMSLAILPRLRRRDDRLNECLVKRFDPSGRLFLASDHPVPEDRKMLLRQQESDIKLGILSINEVRQARGLACVAWGDGPPVQGKD